MVLLNHPIDLNRNFGKARLFGSTAGMLFIFVQFTIYIISSTTDTAFFIGLGACATSYSQSYHRKYNDSSINYVSDINMTINQDNDKVMRSMMILDTQKIIEDIVPIIQNKRYYRAIALLTEQSIKLSKFGQDHHDKELLRDAVILTKYSDKLYDYDEKILQSIKTWHDFTWDSDRYSESFN